MVLAALDVLRNPFSWEVVKRALLGREVRIENFGEQLSPLPTASLRPEPIALDAKVVLIGPSLVYHLLYALDKDFRQLFKVKVDFAPDMDWNDEHVGNYAAFVSRWVERAGLKHSDRSAVARLVEYGGPTPRRPAQALDPPARHLRHRLRGELLGGEGRPRARAGGGRR